MRIALASDHAGYPLKQHLLEYLEMQAHDIIDLGVNTAQVSSDYPDAADAVAQAVLDDRAERGILICGSGVGASVAANKFPGIYCAICHDTYSAHQGVEHDNMNVLCLGARIIGPAVAEELADAFLNAHFRTEVDRYVRRFNMVRAFERRAQEK